MAEKRGINTEMLLRNRKAIGLMGLEVEEEGEIKQQREDEGSI